MPIFKFIAVTGTVLLGLLFVADSMLTPSGPLFTNDTEGLTRPEPKQKVAKRPEPVQAQEAPRPRAPSLLQVETGKVESEKVETGKTEPAQDETVRYELPQSVIAAPAPAATPAPAAIRPCAGRRPRARSGAPAPLAAVTEAAASAPVPAVDADTLRRWPGKARPKRRRSKPRRPSLQRARLRRPKRRGSRPPRSKRPRPLRSSPKRRRLMRPSRSCQI